VHVALGANKLLHGREDTMKIGLAQMNTGNDKAANIASAEKLIDNLASSGAQLVVLPEYFNFIGPEEFWRENSEELAASPSLERMRKKAVEHSVYLHCGSIMEKKGNNVHNTSVVFDPNGDIVATYRKIHLFDVEVPGGRRYLESDIITPGHGLAVFRVGEIIFGLATCYDLRFPELFRALSARGVHVILLPAAFTMMTGKDHWQLLLRARAVENLCYVAAADQYGSCPPNHMSYGRSMVVDPWGVVVAQAGDGIMAITADVDMLRLAEIRKSFPCLDHIRRDMFE